MNAWDDDPIVALFKLGHRAHMIELLREGRVYMNPISFFAALGDGSARADPDEGLGYYKQATGATFKMHRKEGWQTLGTIDGPIRFRDDELAGTNVYCLHAKRRSDYGRPFELSRLGFGDAYVLFLDANELFRRVTAKAREEGREIFFGLVEYVDRAIYGGEMGIFRKFSDRVAESEFRMVLRPGAAGPLSLTLGDLSDIAIIGSTSETLCLDPKPQDPIHDSTAGD